MAAAGIRPEILRDLKLSRRGPLLHLFSKVCVITATLQSQTLSSWFPCNLIQYVFGSIDDRPAPPPAVASPPPPPAPAPTPLPPRVETPPKRPDKSTKPKLPPRPLSKVFSSSDHGSAVLQVRICLVCHMMKHPPHVWCIHQQTQNQKENLFDTHAVY